MAELFEYAVLCLKWPTNITSKHYKKFLEPDHLFFLLSKILKHAKNVKTHAIKVVMIKVTKVIKVTSDQLKNWTN